MSDPRVLVLHNRYRVHGGEERAVDLHLAALVAAGVPHQALVRDSAGVGGGRAAAALLRGGEAPGEVAQAVRALGADVVHAHNMHPLLGPRALAAARDAGARVVLHLHNFRLFCAIGVAFRDGAPCFRCRGRLTLPGLVLNCRGSLSEAAVYAAALSAHQPAVLAAVDRFVAPSRYAVGQLVRLGIPAARIEPLGHHLPPDGFAERSQAHRGTYALAAGRLAPEKGLDTAIEAAALAGVPLRIAGDGPLAAALREQVERLRAPVELLGRVARDRLSELRRGAAVELVPSRSGESFGLSALEAMGAGVPVIAGRAGALPELLGEERCFPPGDGAALAERLSELWRDPDRRRAEGDELIALARRRHGRERFTRNLLGLYARLDAA